MTELSEASKRWHSWWDGVVAAANATPEGIAFTKGNFQLTHTGGGCTAWEREVGDTGWRVLITDSEGLGHKLEANAAEDETIPDYWLIGGQHDDDETGTECLKAATAEEALAAADRVHAELAFTAAIGKNGATEDELAERLGVPGEEVRATLLRANEKNPKRIFYVYEARGRIWYKGAN